MGDCRKILMAVGSALAAALLALPAQAQFPPQGAVADPENPSIAVMSGESTATVGGHTATAKWKNIYYYDCLKKKWVLVASIAGGKERPLEKHSLVNGGPPPGAEISGDGKTAFNPTTGQNFAYDRDKHAWIDVKTGVAVAEPELCPPCPPTETAPRECPGGSTGPKFDLGIGIGGGGYHREHRDEKSQRDHVKSEREEKSSGADCKAKVKECIQACQASNDAISRKCVESGGSPTAGLCTANEDECTCTQTAPDCRH